MLVAGLVGLCHLASAQRAPVILVPPQSQIVASGSNVTFSVSVYSSIPVTYQWAQSGQAIAGGTGQSLLLTNVTVARGGGYSVTVANAVGLVTGSAALGVVSTITQKPASVSPGATFTLSLSTSGVFLQWLYNGTNIPGAVRSPLTVTNLQFADVNAYSLLVTNSGAALTVPITINVDSTFTKVTVDPLVSTSVEAWWGDVDGDGYQDLVASDGNGRIVIYHNNAGSSFTSIPSAAYANFGSVPMSASLGDYNNDGSLDLLAVNSGAGSPAALLQNKGGSTFAVVSNAGDFTKKAEANPWTVTWVDFDDDGQLDAFATDSSGASPGILYRNTGGSNFVALPIPSTVGFGLNGCAWQDYDNDGYEDLFAPGIPGPANLLLRNNGDGTFTRITNSPPGLEGGTDSGCAAWGDYDNDGFPDLFVCNGYFGHTNQNFLYHNEGNGTFTKVVSGVPVGASLKSGAAAWGDYDNDGFLDLFVANFGGTNYSTTNTLYHNNGDGTFKAVAVGSLTSELGGFSPTGWADYDNDGFLDLFVVNFNGNNVLYHNSGNTNGWLKVQCRGVLSNRAAIGAKVRAKAFYRGASRWQLREITGGDGLLNTQPLLAHFGLGDATNIDVLRIEWPSGIVQEITNVPIKQAVTVTEQGVAIFPRVQNLVVGSNLTFTAKTTFAGLLNYQWSFNGLNLLGQTNATLVIQGAQTNDAGAYSVAVTQLNGTVTTSSSALLRLPGPPVITSPPQSQFALAGSTVTLSVGVVPSILPLSYQWRKNAVPIDTHSSLVLANIGLSAAGNYTVDVINSAGTNSTGTATLTVISLTPQPSSVSLGDTLVITAAAGGPFPTGFQWQYNGTNIPSATTKVLTITSAQLVNSTAYGLAVSNSTGTHVFPITLTIDSTFNKITTGPIVTEAGYGAGAAWGDYDNDGFIDLFVGRENGTGNRLYRNKGDGTFANATVEAGVTDAGETRGTAWADYDNDGFLDLFVSNYGGVNFLYRNNGNGTFSRVTTGPVATDMGGSVGAAWGDYDNDGFLDLEVLHNSDDGVNPSPNILYHNEGGGTFDRASVGSVTRDTGFSLGGAWGDFNNDGLLDLVVANAPGPNALYLNLGGGSFQKIATGRIVTDTSASVGVAWGDYDNDGLLDLFVANDNTSGEPHNFLYHNNGDGTFTRITNSVTGAIVTDPAQGWDCAWADYDNDGYLDLFVANQDGPKNALYHNKGDGTFEKIMTGSLANDQDNFQRGSSSCSWGDYDNDGFLDLFASNEAEENSQSASYLYHNNGPNSGNTNGWLKLKCVGVLSNRSGIGAKVRVWATIRGKPLQQLREISGGSGYRSQSGALLAHFGLGDATNVDRVRIEWPSGIVQEMTNAPVRQTAPLPVYEQGVAIFPLVQNLVVGSNFTFTAKTTFAGPLNYQWSFNGAELSGRTDSTLVLTNAQLANVGAYTVAVSGSAVPGTVSSSPALLRLGAAPVITAPPQSQVAAVGSSVILSVTVLRSATPLTYQWLFNSQPVTGVTGPFLVLTNLQLTDGGSYSVVVANGAGAVTNAGAILTVGEVSASPTSVSLGANVNLTATWRPAVAFNLQWQINGTAVPGATNKNLSITNLQVTDPSFYSVAVSNSAESGKFVASFNIDATFTKVTAGDVVRAVPSPTGVPNYPDGCAWGDFNNDGNLDLVTWNNTLPQALLFTNNGDGTLSQVPSANAALTLGVQSTATWADFDNDGYLDLLVTRDGLAELFRNGHNGSFGLTNAGLLTSQTQGSACSGGMAGAWADYDNDGWADVFLNQSLYRNNGEGSFSNTTIFALGPNADLPTGSRIWGDYDNDGYPDLFIINGGGCADNVLYHNRGDGTFERNVLSGSLSEAVVSYASAWADYDNDGFLDLFVANGSPTAGNFLYRNNGNGTFTRSAAFDAISPPNTGTYGCAWGDYDNDGFVDLFLSNYGAPNNATVAVNFLYHNNGDGTFSRVLTGSLANDRDPGAFGSCAWGDYNNDGFLDLYVASQTGHNLLYLNNGLDSGNSNSWIKVTCAGKVSNAAGIGAKVRVKAAYRGASRWQLREITGGDGDDNSQPLLAHFGSGDATNINLLRIEWPSGIVQEMTNVAVKQAITVTEQGVAIFPRVQNIIAGSNLTFTAKTTFAGTLTYQWSFNGAQLSAETNATLVVHNAQAASAGSYTVAVSQLGGSTVNSSPALLRLPGPPVIAIQPQSQSAMLGSDVTFTVGVVPSAQSLFYQWSKDGLTLSGSTGSTLVLTNIDASAGGAYSVTVTNSSGTAISLAANLVVAPAFHLSALPLAQGLFSVRVDVAPGSVLVLQASTNLFDWRPILTNTATNGFFVFPDPDSALFNRRYYRGVQP